MNERCNDRELFTASKDLDDCLVLLNTIQWGFLTLEENEKLKRDNEEDFGHTEQSIKLARDLHDNSRKEIKDTINRNVDIARESFPGVISKLRRNLHIFATASPDVVNLNTQPLTDRRNKFGIECMPPENFIGTSAHHAGILFIENALLSDFWVGEEDGIPVISWTDDGPIIPEPVTTKNPKVYYSRHFQIPHTDTQLLTARLERERLIVFEPNLLSTPGDSKVPISFDDINEIFYSEEDVSVKFEGTVPYQLFKCIFEKRSASFKDLEESVDKWGKDSPSVGAISKAQTRVNKDLENAGLLNKYEICTRNKHIVFLSDSENELTN